MKWIFRYTLESVVWIFLFHTVVLNIKFTLSCSSVRYYSSYAYSHIWFQRTTKCWLHNQTLSSHLATWIFDMNWLVQLLQLNVNKCIAKSFCTIRDNELSMRSFNLSQSMWYIILICFVSISRPELLIETLPDAEEELVSCNLPSGEASHCVSLKRCKSVNALLDNLPEPRSEIVEEYIKESFFCPTKRSSDTEDQVCCPFDGVVNPKPENSMPVDRTRIKEGGFS